MASVRGHTDWGRADPSGFRPTDWLVVPRQALKRRARRPQPRRSEHVSWVLILCYNPGALSGPRPGSRLGWDGANRSRWLAPSRYKQTPPRRSSSCASQGGKAAATQPLILARFGPIVSTKRPKQADLQKTGYATLGSSARSS